MALRTVADLAHSKSQSRNGVLPCRVNSYALMTEASPWASSPVIRNASRKRVSFSSRKQDVTSDADACVRAASFSLTTGNQDMRIASLMPEPAVSPAQVTQRRQQLPQLEVAALSRLGAAQRIASFRSCLRVRTPQLSSCESGRSEER